MLFLLPQLGVDKRDELFAMAMHWLQDDKPAHRRLASQLCGIFVDAEERGFQRRLESTLPLMEELVRPDGIHTVSQRARGKGQRLVSGISCSGRSFASYPPSKFNSEQPVVCETCR